jgi:hypothetical protein
MNMPFDTSEGHKQECRESFITALSNHLIEPKYTFLLPSAEAHDAKLLRSKWPNIRLVGCEIDTTIYHSIMTAHPFIHMYNCSVNKYINHQYINNPETDKIKHDAAFLDYMGAPSESIMSDICDFVKYASQKNLILGVTFQRTPRGTADWFYRFLSDNAYLSEEEMYSQTDNISKEVFTHDVDERVLKLNTLEVVTSAIYSLLLEEITDMKILNVIDSKLYRATTTSSPMYFILFNISRY